MGPWPWKTLRNIGFSTGINSCWGGPAMGPGGCLGSFTRGGKDSQTPWAGGTWQGPRVTCHPLRSRAVVQPPEGALQSVHSKTVVHQNRGLIVFQSSPLPPVSIPEAAPARYVSCGPDRNVPVGPPCARSEALTAAEESLGAAAHAGAPHCGHDVGTLTHSCISLGTLLLFPAPWLHKAMAVGGSCCVNRLKNNGFDNVALS